MPKTPTEEQTGFRGNEKRAQDRLGNQVIWQQKGDLYQSVYYIFYSPRRKMLFSKQY
jgi:hypothetical protein